MKLPIRLINDVVRSHLLIASIDIEDAKQVSHVISADIVPQHPVAVDLQKDNGRRINCVCNAAFKTAVGCFQTEHSWLRKSIILMCRLHSKSGSVRS